jgi:hypothetical protein
MRRNKIQKGINEVQMRERGKIVVYCGRGFNDYKEDKESSKNMCYHSTKQLLS